MKNASSSLPRYNMGLVLAGGGSRAAYQVGILRAVAELAPAHSNPFPVITGVSAGSINAAYLASKATAFGPAVTQLTAFWQQLHTGNIYATDPATVALNGLRWLLTLTFGGLAGANPKSLLDTAPLQELLARRINFDGIQDAIDKGFLQAVGITASDYHTSHAVTFFQSRSGIEPWRRARRQGVASTLGLSHLMASSALPLVFPAQRVGNTYFGDGSLRMTSPLSAAIRLGAERLLIIGMRNQAEETVSDEALPYPSLGEIGGYLLDILFVDNLHSDIERIQRVNNTLSLIDGERREQTGLRHIEVLPIHPSTDILDIARRHVQDLPWTIRGLLRGLGRDAASLRLPSYLMFEPAYISELVELGYHDAMERKQELRHFLGL